MRVLPLYDGPTLQVAESEAPRVADPACARCAAPEIGKVRRRCLNPQGDPGGLLVIGESPGRDEDATGIAFYGHTGKSLRALVARHWSGPIAYDYGVKCFLGNAASDRQVEKSVTACRGYLRATLDAVCPTRVLCVGPLAAAALLGRGVHALSTRRGYAYLGRGEVPVFFAMPPMLAVRNRFLRRWFEADIAWALTTDPPPKPPWGGRVFVVESADDAEVALDAVRARSRAAFDVETAGQLYTRAFRNVRIALVGQGTRDAFVWTQAALENVDTLAPLLDYFSDPTSVKTGQNVKYDTQSVAWATGTVVEGVVGDTRLKRKLLDPEAPASLDAMAELVGMGGLKGDNRAAKIDAVKRVKGVLKAEQARARALERAAAGAQRVKVPAAPARLSTLGIDVGLEALVRAPKTAKVSPESWVYAALNVTAPDVVTVYNARDAVATMALAEQQDIRLRDEPQLQRVYDRIVCDAAVAVEAMETWGIAVDRDQTLLFDRYCKVHAEAEAAKLNGYFPGVNWGSPVQLREILFRKLGLRVVKLTPKELESTDGDTLEALKDDHPLVPTLLEYRHYQHLRSHYAGGILRFIRDDGRIHPSILLDGTRTGRASIADPPLQQMPRPADPTDKDYRPEGKMARDCYVAPPGYVLLSADQSQIELRIAAMLSGDAAMRGIFESGVDFHMRSAQMISQVAWGIAPHEVTKTHRSLVKNIVFGMLYGKTARTFARDFGISVAAAQDIIDAVLGQFVGLAAWLRKVLAETRRTGEAWTYWDGQPARRRALWRIADPKDGIRINAENSAGNTPIQGTAADYTTRGLVDVVKWIRADAMPAKAVLTVHDSLVLEVREDCVQEAAYQVKRIMQSYPAGGVPLVVDIEAGPALGSLVKLAV